MGLKDPFDSISHMIGGVLAIAGTVVLIVLAEGALEIVSVTIYGAGLITLYAMSSIYHGVPGGPRLNAWLERLDHVAIYLLIAGTYTPVTLVMVQGPWGWSIFGVVWGISAVGIILALTAPLGPSWVHITGYIALGWVAVIGAPALFPILTGPGLTLLLGGGIAYTVGSLFYVWNRPRFIWVVSTHNIWHIMVLVASALHYVFILAYVL